MLIVNNKRSSSFSISSKKKTIMQVLNSSNKKTFVTCFITSRRVGGICYQRKKGSHVFLSSSTSNNTYLNIITVF